MIFGFPELVRRDFTAENDIQPLEIGERQLSAESTDGENIIADILPGVLNCDRTLLWGTPVSSVNDRQRLDDSKHNLKNTEKLFLPRWQRPKFSSEISNGSRLDRSMQVLILDVSVIRSEILAQMRGVLSMMERKRRHTWDKVMAS